jgi:hypothetical protein
MAGTGIRSFAKLRGQMPRIATTWIAPWQTALKQTADCQVLRLGCQNYMRSGQACGNPLSEIHTSVCGNPRDGYSIRGNPQSKRRGLPQSAAHIWALNVELDWGIRLKSSPRHFMYIEDPPVWSVIYSIFAARLLEYKIPTRRIV